MIFLLPALVIFVFFPLLPLHGEKISLDTGEEISGTLTSIDSQNIIITTSQGHIKKLPIYSVRGIYFSNQQSSEQPDVEVVLFNDDKVKGKIVSCENGVSVLSKSWGKLFFPFSVVKSIHFRVNPLYKEEDYTGSETDVLLLAKGKDIIPMHGILKSVQEDKLLFHWNLDDTEHTVPISKVFAVILASSVPSQKNTRVTINATDGSCISGENISYSSGIYNIYLIVGGTLACPQETISSILINSGNTAFLSDMEPVKIEEESFFGEPFWHFQKDLTVLGEPIILEGERYNKGLGVHSYSAITFDLKRRYNNLVAKIGLDSSASFDSHVIFKIYGDDKKIFDSGGVNKTTQPMPIQVQIKGVKLLKLVVDFGDNLDLGDHAVWAGIQVSK